MGINKVVLHNNDLIDLTSDTVTSDKMVTGTTAHDKSGNPIIGTSSVSNIHYGNTEPSSDLGNDGDIYIQLS